MKLKYLAVILLSVCLVVGCSNDKKETNSNQKENTLHVAAAASLTDVTKDLETAFKKTN